MAAPTPGTYVAPSGIHLRNGYRTTIGFSADTTIGLWTKTLKPPGMTGLDPIDQTTMHNDAVRTKSAPSLVDFTNATVNCAFDPNLYNEILAMRGTEQTITIFFPDGSTLCFYGYIMSFEINDMQEKQQPTASVQIVPTNWDPVNKVEALPVLTSVAGT